MVWMVNPGMESVSNTLAEGVQWGGMLEHRIRSMFVRLELKQHKISNIEQLEVQPQQCMQIMDCTCHKSFLNFAKN